MGITRTAVRVVLAALAPLAMTATCPGQEARTVHEESVTIPQLSVMRVSSTGRVLPASGYAPRLCNQTVTHSNGNFSGGSYTMQAGFAQGEMLAQTYTAPAADFPIKIISTEAIFATSNATVSTTTAWSVVFYRGAPSATSQIVAFSSDDVVLPHIHLAPGTNGVNVQFSVDPEDPDQIFIPDDGTHTFTVAYRIDQHNNQTGNPCSTGPNTCCNAFPVTDNTVSPPPCTTYGELQQPTLNWLFGLNCGSAGCPANGGWARFSNLQAGQTFGSFCLPGCRPHGDWLVRATWSGVNCTPGVGACCVQGVCSTRTTSDCSTLGGTYQGDGAQCGSVNCPQPQGACCFPNGFCAVVGSLDCAGSSGTFAGQGVACGANNTCPLGGCCLANGTCAVNTTSAACTAQGGTFRGAGTNCSTACPPPNGACCTGNGFCFATSQVNCTGAGGTFYGAGSTCGANNTCPIGACCLADGSCVGGLTSAQCSAQSGTYRGNGSLCSGANCPQPDGACCTGNNFCFITSNATCAGAGGSWKGPGTNCLDANGDGAADACAPMCGSADFNGDGDIGTDGDIESFFRCLSGTCCGTCWHLGADFNGDGDIGTDGDIESFFRVLAGGNC